MTNVHMGIAMSLMDRVESAVLPTPCQAAHRVERKSNKGERRCERMDVGARVSDQHVLRATSAGLALALALGLGSGLG